jgi:AcrR family transcriptional regulator
LFRAAHAERVDPRPQQERSRVTQQRLLDATIDCLIKYGWSGTTTTIVAETAGVSRGAQLHHYPTKTALVLAAVDHLMQRRADEIRAANASGTRDVLEVMAATFTGPLFSAALEVWVAARTDETMREALVPLEARLGRDLYRLTVDLLKADESRPEVRHVVQTTLELLRGLGVANLLNDDSARRRAILDSWSNQLDTILGG